MENAVVTVVTVVSVAVTVVLAVGYSVGFAHSAMAGKALSFVLQPI